MAWKQLLLDTDAVAAPRLEDALLEIGAAAVTLLDRADQPLLEPAPGERPLWREIRVCALFDLGLDSATIIAALRQVLDGALPDHRWQALEDQDWERAWMDDFQPQRFGERLWVCPSWCPPPQPGAVNLLLDPGLAFGTGTHPTTALCLEWLDAQPLAGATVLDYGCGSGILAIAALLLGAEHAVAVDHDPQALQATRDNAERNGIAAERLAVIRPDQLEANATFDVLVANILAAPLIQLAPVLWPHLRDGGRFALSGILATQAGEVAAAWRSGELDPIVQREDWVRISGSRSAGSNPHR
jgi:ribosomal protein L11 methyltransferase